jgi:outer membrane protein OmpA-like peptidoglycan-associated protein
MAELNKVVQLMNDNPTLKIELSAHTDSRGSDEYNLKLSDERAKSCVNYLIQKGIHSNRIIAKGYGETQPIIREEMIEKLRTEEEKEQAHQKNRRTEIKIIDN